MNTSYYSTIELYLFIKKIKSIEPGLITHILFKFLPKYLIYGINKDKHINDNTLIKHTSNINKIEQELFLNIGYYILSSNKIHKNININIIKKHIRFIYEWNTEREQIITSFLDLNGIPFIKKNNRIGSFLNCTHNDDVLYKEIEKYKSCSQVIMYINNKQFSLIWNIEIFYQDDFAEILVNGDGCKFNSPMDFRDNLLSIIE